MTLLHSSLNVRCLLMIIAFVPITYHSSLITALAQSDTAALSGSVIDANGAVIPGVKVTIENNATTFRREVTTGIEGNFTVPLLQPGTYTVIARREGFAQVRITNVVLNVGDQKSLKIELNAGTITETVEVTNFAGLINESTAVGTVVDRVFVENLPLNGRSFQSLITLTPGVVLTKVAAAGEQGQFSVNGQRGDSNYFMVDGVSANFGIVNASGLGQSASGALPGNGVTGGTNNLVSVDAVQEFRIQSSTFAPEFGRTPGAQVSIVTRSGTNEFHGSLFEYFRNDALDATDWFVNANRLAKPPLRQNDFGFVVGGPILLPRLGEGGRQPWYNGRNRTFFFFSYEGLRLVLPQTSTTDVPSLSARLDPRVTAPIRRLLNAYPLPNGPETGGGFARFAASYSDSSTLNASSVKIDHTLNDALTLFGRYSYAPSNSTQRGTLGTPLSQLSDVRLDTLTLTGGATWIINSNVSNDLRINYSRVHGLSSVSLDNFGGAVPITDSPFDSPAVSLQDSTFGFGFTTGVGTVYSVGKGTITKQRQVNLVDSLSVAVGTHQLKFGVDYRRLSPVSDPWRLSEGVQFTDVNQAVSNAPANISLFSVDGNVLYFTNFSAFAQDTWKATRRLTLTYGFRWDVNPPPSGEKELFTFTGGDNPATLKLAPSGTPLWKTTYDGFAPRGGIAFQLSQKQGRETVLRGGFGIFHDLGSNTTGNVTLNFPYSRLRFLLEQYPSPLAVPTPLSFNPPYGTVRIFDSNLKLPRTYQWNLSIEQSLGPNQTATATYVGAAGRRLLRRQDISRPTPDITTATITRNTSTSDYHALQVQFQRRLSNGLQALASYSWSHSIDDVSTDAFSTLPTERVDPRLDRGSSDFDVRHSFNAAISYNLPIHEKGGMANAVFGNWSIDAIYRARTATPVNVITGLSLFGVFRTARPDLIPGVPLYLNDPTAPGGRRINPAAFASPPVGRQGTLGRNSLRGFSLSQVDFSLRRQFDVTERVNLQLKAEFFNILNHPNFADPNPVRNTSTFGRSTQMLGRSLGSAGLSGGTNPLFQIGGPRSIQFALRLGF